MKVLILLLYLSVLELFRVPRIYSFSLSNFRLASNLKPRHKGFYLCSSLKEDELTKLIEDYDFQGAYEMMKNDPMLKISKENARKVLNNIRKVDKLPVSNSRTQLSKKGAESSTLIYRRLEKQKVLRGFNCLQGAYPESSTEITSEKLEAISGLPLTALTPKRRTTYWQVVGIALALSELILGIYFGIDPVFTLIPITIFAFAFDQILLKGAIFETLYRFIFPTYKKKIIAHEAGHFMVAYLLGLPISGIVTSAWEARKYPEIKGSAGTIFFDSKFSEELEAGKVTRASLDRLSIAFMAGIAAEALEFGICEGGAADEKALISLFSAISPPWNILKIRGQARWAVTQCLLLLREHRDAFKAAIKALEQQKEIGDIIFDIEAHLPLELPSLRRLEEQILQRKEKDRELLFRTIQTKTWKVGGIQPLESFTEETNAEPSILGVESKLEEQEQDIIESRGENDFDTLIEKFTLLQRAVQTGDINPTGKTMGGIWLNNLSSLRKTEPVDSLSLSFTSKAAKNEATKFNRSQSDFSVRELLQSHRGYMMKELELLQQENLRKLEQIDQRLTAIN